MNPWSLKLGPIALVVSLFTAIAIVLLALGMLAATRKTQDAARSHEQALVANGLKLKDSSLRACLGGNAVWDDAVKNLAITYSADWAQKNVGQFYATTCHVSRVFVIDSTDRLIGSWKDGTPTPLDISPRETAAVSRLIKQVRARELARGRLSMPNRSSQMISRPIDETAPVSGAAQPSVIAISLVQPDFGKFMPGERAPIVGLVEPVDQTFLDWLGQHFMLEGLHLASPTAPSTPGDGHAMAQLLDNDGAVVARFIWTSGDPARALINAVAVPLGLLLLILVLVPAITIWRESSQLRRLSEAVTAANAASSAKSRFIANMSHEIRTPMNGVLGILRLLRGKLLDPDSVRLVNEALASGVLLQGLLNDVLDLSRIEEGKIELSVAPTDPNEAVRDVVLLFAREAEQKGVDLRWSADHPDLHIMADGLRLRQILLNLIGNAVKFTPSGSVHVRTTIKDGVNPNQLKLRIEVQDTGIGISRSAQDKLFQRFVQADASTARRYGGSGLGLSISDALIKLMGGEIGVQSEDGAGSTFWFEFEAPGVVAPKAASPSPLPEPEPDLSLSALRVLLVEDNPTNQLVAERLLQALGVDVAIAVNGLEGVLAANASLFDLILMDIQMPLMDGVAATRRIRSENGLNAKSPIIGLTANVLPHQIMEYLEAGMDDVAAKPIVPADLFGKINAALQAA